MEPDPETAPELRAKRVGLVMTSPPYGLDVNYQDADDSDYAGWLGRLATWLAELYRVAQHASGRLCLNVPLDRESSSLPMLRNIVDKPQ